MTPEPGTFGLVQQWLSRSFPVSGVILHSYFKAESVMDLDYLIEGDEGLTVQTNDMLGDSLSDTGVLGVMILVMLAAMIYSRYKMELTKNLVRTTARIINYVSSPRWSDPLRHHNSMRRATSFDSFDSSTPSQVKDT
uniref:Uncharacterized protein n=1 Tax=Timema poppense TaxID=170557 RepID=A0A7R9CZP7_TIMPO|nr:unnamed protein product [Timema poppensis]